MKNYSAEFYQISTCQYTRPQGYNNDFDETRYKHLMLAECDSFKNFNNFSLITGAQRDKLLRFIKENYFEREEFLEKILVMYLKLNENNENHLNVDLIKMTVRFSEEQQLKFAIYILGNDIGCSEDIKQMAKCQIIQALGQDKIKFFLSDLVLNELLDTVDIETNTILKKNLFLQYLFCDEIIMLQRGFEGKLGAAMMGYEYDFGSTTELMITVVNYRVGAARKEKLIILSRNDPIKILCEEYGEEMFLDVCNSPRMGVCGYCGSDAYPDQFVPDV